MSDALVYVVAGHDAQDERSETSDDLVVDLRDPNWTHAPQWLLLKAADEIERLRSALAYYASPYNWNSGEVPGHIYAHADAGNLARRTLGMSGRLDSSEEFMVEMQCREIMNDA